MVRPKRKRRVVKCHKYHINENLKPIQLSVDEFEAIRFKDYHNIKQTEAAEFMGISQSTFHRILNSARNKLAKSLIEGKKITIIRGETEVNTKTYLCNGCGFQWSNPKKEYFECPECNSKDIQLKNMEIDKQSLREYECPKCKGINCKSKNCPKNNFSKHSQRNCKKFLLGDDF